MRTVISLAALASVCVVLAAAENPQVAAIHEQIKVLRAEESATLKNIHAWYESFIKRDKLTGAVKTFRLTADPSPDLDAPASPSAPAPTSSSAPAGTPLPATS